MTLNRLHLSLALFLAGCGVVPVLAEDPGKSPKELMQYVEKARKAGQKDEEIRKAALAAGWNPTAVDQALVVVKQAAAENAVAVPEGYKIGAGDVLQIVVWKELDASVPEVVVRSDNKITLPLIKEVEVGGLTPVELEKKLTAKLSEMINNPNVTVIAKSIRSQKIYMLGAVKKEGPIMMVGPMTVLQAIGEAGGLTDYAKRKKIYILRNQNGKQVRLPFDYDAVLKGQRMELNVQVMPDDTIVVPN